MGESEQSAFGTDIPKTYNIVSETLFRLSISKTKTFRCPDRKQRNMNEEEVIILTVTKDR